MTYTESWIHTDLLTSRINTDYLSRGNKPGFDVDGGPLANLFDTGTDQLPYVPRVWLNHLPQPAEMQERAIRSVCHERDEGPLPVGRARNTTRLETKVDSNDESDMISPGYLSAVSMRPFLFTSAEPTGLPITSALTIS